MDTVKNILIFSLAYIAVFAAIEMVSLEEQYKQTILENEFLKEEIASLQAPPESPPEVNPKILEWVTFRAKPNLPRSYLKEVILEAQKHDNFLLILSVAAVESNYDPFVSNSYGAIGLCQVVPKWWLVELKEQGILERERQLFDFRKNIAASDYILNEYKKRFGDINTVLVRFSGGATDYDKKVLNNLKQLQELV